jgi:spermidine/putrescine transport system permease protein
MRYYIQTSLLKIKEFYRQPIINKTFRAVGNILKYMFFIFVILLLYAPIFIIAIQSVNSSDQFYEFTSFSLKWYGELIRELDFANPGILGASIQRTIIIAFLSTSISTVLGTIFAIGIHFLNKKARQRIVFLNQVPILNADIVSGISLMIIFKLITFIIPNIFGFPTLLLAHIFFSLPYVVLSIMPKLGELDENLYDASMDLGCRPFEGIYKVIVPAIYSGIFTGMLIAFTMSIDDFVISYFTTGNGYDNVSIWVYSSVGRRMSPAVYAYNTLLSVIVIVIIVGFNLYKMVKNKKNKNLMSKGVL